MNINKEFSKERILIRSILREYTEPKVILTEQELNESLKDIILGIALLVGGFKMDPAQAQMAKQALSNDDIKGKIESVLKDTSSLNKVTENLPTDVKNKIFKNKDKALEDLTNKNGRVTSTVKAKDEKQLTSRLKQGYTLTDIDTETDTVKGKGKVITYTESLDFSINSDGLFVTGGYKLSPKGIQTIQNIRDSIQEVGGEIESVVIEAGTDKEPIKMGNQKLAELRAESVSTYFTDVDSVSVNTDNADAGPDFNSLVKKIGREKSRIETAEYRYVKITINATYQDTILDTKLPEEKVIEKNTYTLIKTISEKHGKTIKIKRKNSPKIKRRTTCKLGNTGAAACPKSFGKKMKKFLNFSHQ